MKAVTCNVLLFNSAGHSLETNNNTCVTFLCVIETSVEACKNKRQHKTFGKCLFGEADTKHKHDKNTRVPPFQTSLG